jgi:hypothetical protein
MNFNELTNVQVVAFWVKMEAARCCKTLVSCRIITRCYNPQDINLYNLNSYDYGFPSLSCYESIPTNCGKKIPPPILRRTKMGNDLQINRGTYRVEKKSR